MFPHLQIPYRTERWLVGAADAGLSALMLAARPFRRTPARTPPARILLLRLERIGDLLMVLDAIAMVRQLAPASRIDLCVGSWNVALAQLIAGVDEVESLDVPWMSRERRGLSWPALGNHAKSWRSRDYDLAINFEPDIRSNLLLAFSGARRTVGFDSGGGGSLLSEAVAANPSAHIAQNAKMLVASAFGRPDGALDLGTAARTQPLLRIPEEARRRAVALLGALSPRGTTIGIQPGAGRRIKEWDPLRFAEVGTQLARVRGAKVVLIGSAGDQAALEAVRSAWPVDVPRTDLPLETDLVVLAAVLERLSLFVIGDTGPMHLAAAMGTPVLAIFGPSLPSRYAPLSPGSRIVRIDIHCSPCNLLRRPPERCVGHVPDCLTGIQSIDVIRAANEMLGS